MLMKKMLFLCSFLLSGMVANAQLSLTPHVGAGVGVGSTGISIDASATVTDFFGARVGVNIMPKFKYGTSLDLTKLAGSVVSNPAYKQFLADNGIDAMPEKVDVEGKLNMTTWHVLFDVYPFSVVSSFHVTVGAYFGGAEIIDVYNENEGALKAVAQYNDKVSEGTFTYKGVPVSGAKKIGAELGDYFLEPTTAGNVKANIQVKKFRPYVGLGFGRAVPKGRLGCQFDLGCQFWGTPEIYTYGKNGEYKLEAGDTSGDAGKILKVMSKVTVFPVLKVRLVGRIL